MRMRLAAILALLSSPAAAGDFATLNSLGFSPNGKVFAFEQYGVQDGSGFPHAEIFFVDLDEDRLLTPSPVRVRLEDNADGVEDARAEARRQAAPLFEEHEPNEERGSLVAASPPTELSADPHRMVFLPRAIEPSIDAPVELRIDLVPNLGAPDYCEGLGHHPMGFRLTRTATAPGESVAVLHEDDALPESRNCPYDYRLAEIWVYENGLEEMRAVALVGVKSIGFEGPDMRYIAVPVPLD
jgi:predicted secreted protein